MYDGRRLDGLPGDWVLVVEEWDLEVESSRVESSRVEWPQGAQSHTPDARCQTHMQGAQVLVRHARDIHT